MAVPSTKFRSEISMGGYRLSVLKSALQKYMRRGVLDKTLYCASDLASFDDIQGGTPSEKRGSGLTFSIE